jgi:hypothetical protein
VGETFDMSHLPGPEESEVVAGILRSIEASGQRLCISSFGYGDGGLGVLSSTGVEVIDRASTLGLDSDGRFVARAFQTVKEDVTDGSRQSEVALYDAEGLLRLERLDDVGEIHDVLLDGDSILVVSTGTDDIKRYRPGPGLRPSIEVHYGTRSRVDTWHLNCLCRHGDQIVATAFARSFTPLWRKTVKKVKGANRAAGRGEIIDIDTGETVVGGFAGPHSPRRWGDWWVVANAANRSLMAVKDGEEDRWELACGGWTRGLAIWDDHAIIAVSAQREKGGWTKPHTKTCLLLFIDLKAREAVGSITIPFREVYDLTLISEELIGGLRRGAGTNALRVLERAACEGYWPAPVETFAMEPLEQADWEADVTVDVPASGLAESRMILDVEFTYRGTAGISSVGYNSVNLGWYWDHPESPNFGRAGFAKAMGRGDREKMVVPVLLPDEPGRHTLHIGIVQEHVAWFRGGVDVEVEVEPRPDDFTEDMIGKATR